MQLHRRGEPGRILATLGIAGTVACLALGCADAGETDDAPVTVFDSAGVRIVAFEGDPYVSAPAIPVELVYRHGDGPSDYAFQYAAFGGLTGDGGAVVADLGNQEVVRIGPGAERAEHVARTGQGPGEVRQVSSVHVVGSDSVWVEDDGNAKIALFVDGAFERSVSTQGNATLTRSLGVADIGGDGRFLMSTQSYRSTFEEPWLAGHFVWFDPPTGRLDTVAAYDMALRRPERGINPFGPFGVATTTGDGFAHARSDRPAVTWRDRDGRVRQVVRWTPEHRYPSRADWDRFEARIRADLQRVNPQMGADELRSFVDDRVASYALQPDEPLPLFGRIHGEREGGVWLADFSVDAETIWPTRYQVLSSAGAWRGYVEFPGPLSLLDVRGELVLGAAMDAVGVQRIEVYRVRSVATGR
jgi:hypothetical protein